MTHLKSHPVRIGIRPTIDGRRLGVRESLEVQTMAMAINLSPNYYKHIFVIQMVSLWNV